MELRQSNTCRDNLEEVEVRIKGHWKRISYVRNNTGSDIQHTINWSNEQKTCKTDETTNVVKQSNKASKNIVTDAKVVKASGSVEEGREYDNTVKQMGIKGIQSSRQENSTYTIPKDKSLVTWQFVPDNFVNYDDLFYTMSTTDDEKKPEEFELTATVAFKRKITFGETKIRIRYKGSDRYLTTINRRFLILLKRPAAALGRSTECHFILQEKDPKKKTIIIESANENRLCLSSRTPLLRDWVCLAKNEESSNHCWSINKISPLYDGDVVTFRHGDRYLCHKMETKKSTDVYCLPRRESEWILEVVD